MKINEGVKGVQDIAGKTPMEVWATAEGFGE